MKKTISFRLNGRAYTVEADPCDRMLDILRNDLALRATQTGALTDRLFTPSPLTRT